MLSSPQRMNATRTRNSHDYVLAAVLDRALLIPRKCRDLDLDRTDLAPLALLRLLSSSSSSSMYFGLWILKVVSLVWLVKRTHSAADGYVPTIANHAHSLGFCHAVESGCLLEVLLAANPLGIAETSLSKGINIAPVCKAVNYRS